MDDKSCVQFVSHVSSVNPSFWSKLAEIKLNVDKLNEHSHNIWGYFTNFTAESCPIGIFEVDSTSFNKDICCQQFYLPAYGKVLNKNTIEQFKDCDKNKLLNEESEIFFELIKNDGIDNPALLNFFFILSFADLKKYHFYYWFAFPVPVKCHLNCNLITPITEIFNDEQLIQIHEKYMSTLNESNRSYFIIKKDLVNIELCTLKSQQHSNEIENYYFTFSDISTNENPGWPLRNYIVLILLTWPHLSGKCINFIAYRLNRLNSKITCKNSKIFQIILPDSSIFSNKLELAWFGWEKNDHGKFGPKMANMKKYLDPKSLAESAVDLNLKLMKWRLLPDIDLDKIKNTKCLLLGSGTLGCSVARTLLGWGVRRITFVDNSTVSFSNPVRQSLFTYENCLKNTPKSIAAAENLKIIFPGVESKGIQLSIPMPGHQIGESLLEQTKNSVTELQKLVEECDVMFLLMDSRESRWLPTVLGNAYDKIVINAALGFDTYLVMRHGASSGNEDDIEINNSTNSLKRIPGNQLGCYFCNDVTAPGNSLKDRSLDQQCTVTRPGVSAIAGALAVELAISLIQHQQNACAPAYLIQNANDNLEDEAQNGCLLGIIPHSIRGFLSTFSHVLPATPKYKQCVACSDYVINEYKSKGFEFLIQVFNSSKYLEDLTGLSDKQKECEDVEIWEFSDEEDVE